MRNIRKIKKINKQEQARTTNENLKDEIEAMNVVSVLKVGFKVLVAAITGAAVYLGIKSGEKIETQTPPPGQSQPAQVQQQNNNQQTNVNTSAANNGQTTQPQQGNLTDGLKSAQNTCGKVYNFIQSLTMMAESLGRLFTNPGGNDQVPPQGWNPGWQGYYNDPWSIRYPQPIQGGPQYARLSPFIIDTTPQTTPQYYPQGF